MSENYGVTSTGFILKSYDQIKADMVARARAFYGETLDERSTNPLIKFIEDISLELAFDWQVLQQMFNNVFLVSANGSHVDKLGFELAILRKEGTKSLATLKLTGTVGAVVPSGSRFKTAIGTDPIIPVFKTTTQLTIGLLNELYDAGPSISETFVDGDEVSTSPWVFDLAEKAYDDGNATCTFNGISLTEVGSSPSAGEFSITYGVSAQLTIGNAMTSNDVVIVTYTYESTFYSTSALTLNKVPIDPMINMLRGTQVLTEVASGPGANEFAADYVTGVITLGQVVVITDVFTAVYLDSTALDDTVVGESVTVGVSNNVEANKLTIIESPIGGISAVNNEAPATGGSNSETDDEYRIRLIGVSRTQWTIAKIESEVEGIDGVRSATINGSFIIDEFEPGDEISTSPLTFELTEKPVDPLKRVEIQSITDVVTILTEVSGAPGTGEFQVDYPSEVPGGPWIIEMFDSDLGGTDKLVVTYNDVLIGEGYFTCFVVGEASPIPTSVIDDVRSKLFEVKPLSIGFQILEAEPVLFDLAATITLDEGFESSQLQDIEDDFIISLDSLVNTLNIQDVLIRNELVKRLMNVDGVNDATIITLTLYDEQHTFATGTLDYELAWTQGSTVLYVKSLDKQTDYSFTFDADTNEMTFDAGTPSNGDVFLIKYESISGNVSPRTQEIITRGAVDVTL